MCTNFKDFFFSRKDGQNFAMMSWPLEPMFDNGRRIYYASPSYMYHRLIIPHLERIDHVVLKTRKCSIFNKNHLLLIVKLSDPC